MKESIDDLRTQLANTKTGLTTLAAIERERGLTDEEKEQFDVGMEKAKELSEAIGQREKRVLAAESLASLGASLGDGRDEEDDPDDRRYRDAVSKFVHSDKFRAIAKAGTGNRPSRFTVETEYKAVDNVDITTPNDAEYDALPPTVRPGIIQPFVQPATVGSLFTQGAMDSASVAWFSVGTDADAAADVVEVGAQKPPGTASVDFQETRARKVASTLTVPEEALDDISALETTLRAILLNGPGGLAKKFEDQYVNGAGTGSGEIEGILTLSPTDNTIPGARTSQSLLFASLEIQRVTGFQADAVVLNPADVYALMSEDDDNSRPLWGSFGSFYQLPGGPARYVMSNAVAAGTAIVGAFRSSILYTRRASAVRATAEGIGLADKNLVMFVAEGRQALVHPYGANTYRTVSIETVSS